MSLRRHIWGTSQHDCLGSHERGDYDLRNLMKPGMSKSRTKSLAIWASYIVGMHGFGVNTGEIAYIAICNEQTSAWHRRFSISIRLYDGLFYSTSLNQSLFSPLIT
jgi:hypothetical protein